MEAEERSRFRLSLEELLLRCRDACGEAAEVTLATKKRGHHLTVELALPTGCSGLPAGDGSPLDTLVSEWKAGSRRGMNTLVYTFLLQNTTGDLFRFVWKYTKPHKWWFFLGVATQLIMVAVQVAAPLISAKVIIALSDNATEQILLAAGSLLAINALSDLVVVSRPYRYPLWTLPEDSLKLHPYIRSYAAHGIVLFRSASPREDWTVEGLVKAGILKPEQGAKLARCAAPPPGE